MATFLSPSRRVRRTPFSRGVEASGVKAYTVYNRMLLPTVFESVEQDYHHLKANVQVWDVSCERQVALQGPDAFKLIQTLTPRDLSAAQPGRCYYIPVVNQAGGMLNDPVAFPVDENLWWISIADSDLLYWIKGLAYGFGFDVHVYEPDVSPLGVQGPHANDLMARVFGDEVRSIGFFKFKRLPFGDTSFIVARSGYSKQGGFEIYVEGSHRGMPLWEALFEAGRDLNVRAGGPNLIERIEAGLFSYGNDMTSDNTPFECGLGKFCNRKDKDYIGYDVLSYEKTHGPSRQIRPLSIAGDPLAPLVEANPLYQGDKQVGQVTSLAWSPDFKTNVAIGMVDSAYWDTDTELKLNTDDGDRTATVRETFWI